MSNIIIKEKNKNESFDDIKELLAISHKDNINKGIIMNSQSLSSKELKQRVGEDGICFIAKDNDKLVGTNSIRIVKRNTWYAKGNIPDYILAAVHPKYQGQHINSLLIKKIFEYVKQKNYPVIELDTAANNKQAIKVYKHQGFKLVRYTKYPNSNHYSVIMVKWMSSCPYSNLYCNYKYYKSMISTRLKKRIKK